MPRRWIELLLPALVLGILLVYSFARFYLINYVGFQYNGASGQVSGVHSFPGQPSLLAGEIILEINGLPWSDFPLSHRPNPLATAKTGEVLHLSVQGDSGQREVDWRVPGFNFGEFIDRLVNTWVLSYFFWVAGTAILILVRPRDARWVLLIAFNYITAIWLLPGSISGSGVLEAPYVLRAGVWLSLPIYLHLHWNFPRPLGRIPGGAWVALYVAAVAMLVAQWANWVPASTYLLAFIIAVLGSVGILAFRFFFRAQERREIGVLFFAAALALAPAVGASLTSTQVNSSLALSGTILTMVALPGAYFYVVYRRQLGGLEFRANRLISIYLFLAFLVLLAILFIPLLTLIFPEISGAGATLVLTALVTALISIFSFPRFQTFVERRLLGVPQLSLHVAENFAGRISTSFSRETLAQILSKEVLPSLLIRQSGLIDFEGKQGQHQAVYLQGVKLSDLPDSDTLKRLHNEMIFQPQGAKDRLGASAAWVRLALPLAISGELRGFWLLGRKDPDDYYSQAEVNLLRSLADQTAIALANISQAQSLRALHHADIERQEVERVHLARELHDDILHRIDELGAQVDDAQYANGFGKKFEALVGQVRNLINGLRPPMMDQGLYFALQDLAGELAQRPGAKTVVKLEVLKAEARFDPMVEQHLFRIVQQACENALQHSQAQQIVISGRIDTTGAELQVKDDGQGFTLPEQTNLAAFLDTRHFGLAGMQERVAMIDAKLSIDTAAGKGTSIRLHWLNPS